MFPSVYLINQRCAIPSKSRRKMRNCLYCNLDITGSVNTRRYCSDECQSSAEKERQRNKVLGVRGGKLCVECNQPLAPHRGNRELTCSPECAKQRINALRKMKGKCCIDGCNNPMKYNGGKYAKLCAAHAWRKKHGKEMVLPIKGWVNKQEGVCSFVPCGRKEKAMGLCASHYEMTRRGEPLRVIQMNPQKRPGSLPIGHRSKTTSGYFRVKTKDGWRYEHIIVMENFLGRPIRKEETVHHVNGDKLDNRIDNLELWSKSHPAGQRVLDKVKWAHEILELYGREFDPRK